MKRILDWEEYLNTSRQVVAEGCVLLQNKNNVLPLVDGAKVAVFGRIQNHYYKSGTGSGGMVNVTKVVSILDALKECREISLDETLLEVYAKWEADNPYEEGMGWGNEPWSQKEMPLEDSVVEASAKESDIAIVIVGRTAGEDQDVRNEAGSYLLTDLEEDMLRKVRANFDKMIVLLNVGGIVDMHFIDDTIKPEAVMYVWQGGMIGGSGTVDVLTGKVNPSGKLPDTIAYELEDYSSHKNFGDDNRNFYQEDIYVGYRYFETFAKARVRYPFGFGLSYTTFEMKTVESKVDEVKQSVSLTVQVKNTGAVPGKEVVQVYGNPAQGMLGKPVRNLVAFKKTEEIAAGESVNVSFDIPFTALKSYDDSGVTGNKSCWIMEAGEYSLFVGNNVADAECVCTYNIPELIVVERLEEALAPVLPFKVMKPTVGKDGVYQVSMVDVATATIDMDERRNSELPKEITQTGDKGIKLSDVLNGNSSMEEFIAQLSDDELCSLVRGEGMGSSRVTAGTASAFGGVSNALVAKDVPAICCDDGPSGMRMDCGTKAFSLPNGTMIASGFNPELVEKLYQFTGREMVANNVECLLGPGMNIHRHPLNGRNFEYFSEDPYLTGAMACAMVNGLQSEGVTGTVKHFCGNNQEKRRHYTDSVISERALREIYLKGFEMVIKDAKACSVMTTYGSVNGLWTAGIYDLTTTILRKQWGFKGVVMTDWWAMISERGKEPNKTNFAAMVRAQNDLYMCCPNGERNESGENTMEALEKGTLTRGELQRTAINVCEFAMNSQAMKRLMNTADEIEIINREADEDDVDISDVEYLDLNGTISIPLPNAKKNEKYIIALDVKKLGRYRIVLTGSSELGELAQLPCTLFFNGFPVNVFTFNGTGGKEVSLECALGFFSRFAILRLVVGSNGLDLKDIRFEYVDELQ